MSLEDEVWGEMWRTDWGGRCADVCGIGVDQCEFGLRGVEFVRVEERDWEDVVVSRGYFRLCRVLTRYEWESNRVWKANSTLK